MTNKLVAGERSKHTISRILEVLAESPRRVRELAQRIHLDRRHIRRVLGILQKRSEVHIVRWDRDEPTNYPVSVWGLGNAPDAKKPRASSVLRARRYRAKLRRERPEEHMRRLKRKRAARLRPKRDIAAAWIVPLNEDTNT